MLGVRPDQKRTETKVSRNRPYTPKQGEIPGTSITDNTSESFTCAIAKESDLLSLSGDVKMVGVSMADDETGAVENGYPDGIPREIIIHPKLHIPHIEADENLPVTKDIVDENDQIIDFSMTFKADQWTGFKNLINFEHATAKYTKEITDDYLVISDAQGNRLVFNNPSSTDDTIKTLEFHRYYVSFNDVDRLYSLIINETETPIAAEKSYVYGVATTEKDSFYNAEKAFSARIRKVRSAVEQSTEEDQEEKIGTELSGVYGVDICPIYLDGEGDNKRWVLDVEAKQLKFSSITTITSSGKETTYNNIDGVITRGRYITQNASSGSNSSDSYKFELFEYYLIDRKYTIDTGICTAGIVSMLPLSTEKVPLENLFVLNESETIVKEVKTINNNIALTYDNYYYLAYRMIMQDGANANFIFLTTGNENNKLGIKFFYPVIPVTSDTIYTNTLDFLSVMQDPNFSTKRTTKYMGKLIEIDDTATGMTIPFSLTTNNYKLTKYINDESTIDDFYYNFEISENDLWKKLGFIPAKIEYTRDGMISYKPTNKSDESNIRNQVYPIYTIKGVYYSETLYYGPLHVQYPVKIESKTAGENGNIRKFIVPAGYDLFKFSTSAENLMLYHMYFEKTIHYGQQLMLLTIPKTIEVKMTQNKDIEEYLNSNEITDSIANIGQYQVVRENEPSIHAIQQQLTINTTLELPDNSPVYIFLTNGNQIYSLMDTVATLNIEYIN